MLKTILTMGQSRGLNGRGNSSRAESTKAKIECRPAAARRGEVGGRWIGSLSECRFGGEGSRANCSPLPKKCKQPRRHTEKAGGPVARSCLAGRWSLFTKFVNTSRYCIPYSQSIVETSLYCQAKHYLVIQKGQESKMAMKRRKRRNPEKGPCNPEAILTGLP
jgi:hypothetical protein